MGTRKVHITKVDQVFKGKSIKVYYAYYSKDQHNVYQCIVNDDLDQIVNNMCKGTYIYAYPGDKIKITIALDNEEEVKKAIEHCLKINSRYVKLKNLKWVYA